MHNKANGKHITGGLRKPWQQSLRFRLYYAFLQHRNHAIAGDGKGVGRRLAPDDEHCNGVQIKIGIRRIGECKRIRVRGRDGEAPR